MEWRGRVYVFVCLASTFIYFYLHLNVYNVRIRCHRHRKGKILCVTAWKPYCVMFFLSFTCGGFLTKRLILSPAFSLKLTFSPFIRIQETTRVASSLTKLTRFSGFADTKERPSLWSRGHEDQPTPYCASCQECPSFVISLKNQLQRLNRTPEMHKKCLGFSPSNHEPPLRIR